MLGSGFLARSLLGFEARLLRRLAFRLGLGFALAILLFLARHLRLEARLLGLELRFHFGFAPRSLLGLLVFLLPCLGGRLFQRHAAQLGDLSLGERGVDASRELLHVQLEVVRIVAVLDGAPELELDLLITVLRVAIRGSR